MYKFSRLWWIIGMRTNRASTTSETIAKDASSGTWIDNEVAGCSFKDARLAKRFGKLLVSADGQNQPGGSNENQPL
jgi:hypothetical protein